jgi:hypothetical protein
MRDYPIDSMELARRVVGYREGTPAFVHLVQRCIRPALRRFNCPKTGPAVRSHYIIDREMAERVAAECGVRLRP